MMRVTLSFESGATSEVLLAGIPRSGESIRLRNGRAGSPSLVVQHVTWIEGEGDSPEPTVLVTVRERDRRT
jgi:hypothetical protein